MKKLFKKIFNNKGFTLVELIVVIAVLGVITVLAIPQFTKYVEKSRAGTDANALGEVLHAVEVAYVAYGKDDPISEFQIRIRTDGNTIYAPSVNTVVQKVEETVPAYVYKSEEYRGNTYTIEIDENGKAKLHGSEGNKDYANAPIGGTSLKGVVDFINGTFFGGIVEGIIDVDFDTIDWEEVNDYVFETETDLTSIVNNLKSGKLSQMKQGANDLKELLDEVANS